MIEATKNILRRHFGYENFREGQQEVISAIVSGRDALGIMPTGAGKSLCFQIPALMADGTVIVVSPLISLMKDQVEALRQAGLPAAFINSTLTAREHRAIASAAENGEYKLIYIAPERLENLDFLEFLNRIQVTMVTIDEAHCVSQWGHDFRPSYLRIADMIDTFTTRPVVSAFTATATPAVKDDIVRLLRLRDPATVITGFDRKNLYFEVNRPSDKMRFALDFVRRNTGRSGIVYCITRKLVESVCENLKAAGIPAVRYHAGLPLEERSAAQESFIFDDAGIIVATNAFGMGIDKSNVRFVLHYNMPKNIESYYQEAGRAGRDGEKADCVLLYSGQDVIMNKFLIENSDKDRVAGGAAKADKSVDLKKLSSMIEYCSTSACLRGRMLEYFGETRSSCGCGNCGNCVTSGAPLTDMTEVCARVLTCVRLMGERFGNTFVSEVLRGENAERARGFGFDRLPVFGSLADRPLKFIKSVISQLAADGYLRVDPGQYQTLSLEQKAVEALETGGPIMLRGMEPESRKPVFRARPEEKKTDQGLFDRLRALRMALSKKYRVPPYLIFSDAALNGMCADLPRTDEQFLAVSGVGRRKLEQYGALFMGEIRRFLDEKKNGA